MRLGRFVAEELDPGQGVQKECGRYLAITQDGFHPRLGLGKRVLSLPGILVGNACQSVRQVVDQNPLGRMPTQGPGEGLPIEGDGSLPAGRSLQFKNRGVVEPRLGALRGALADALSDPFCGRVTPERCVRAGQMGPQIRGRVAAGQGLAPLEMSERLLGLFGLDAEVGGHEANVEIFRMPFEECLALGDGSFGFVQGHPCRRGLAEKDRGIGVPSQRVEGGLGGCLFASGLAECFHQEAVSQRVPGRLRSQPRGKVRRALVPSCL